MFGKLMKYEFKGTAKLLLMIYAFIGIIGLMAYVLGLTNIDVGAGLLTFIYIAAGVVLPFMTNLLMAIRYLRIKLMHAMMRLMNIFVM